MYIIAFMISQGVCWGMQGLIHSIPSRLPGNAVCEEHPEAEAPTAQAGGTGNEPVFWMAGPARQCEAKQCELTGHQSDLFFFWEVSRSIELRLGSPSPSPRLPDVKTCWAGLGHYKNLGGPGQRVKWDSQQLIHTLEMRYTAEGSHATEWQYEEEHFC